MNITLETADRRLATVETVADIRPIVGADAIECARVRGWDVVVPKDEFQVGDPVLYVEVDAFLPLDDPRFEFLRARGEKTDDNGNVGHVVKTARLRGQYSQGIVFKPCDFPELEDAQPGDDFTSQLSITKWDPPLPAGLVGTARGYFPTWIQKTSEERIQNAEWLLGSGDGWVATEKIDGSSMTVWIDGEYEGVASRNLDILRNADNLMWAKAAGLNLHTLARQVAAAFGGSRAAIQGEIFGPGLPTNPLQMRETTFRIFTVYVDGTEVPRSEWTAELTALSVPCYDLPYPATVDEALTQVDGLKSLLNPERAAEGVVWRHISDTTVADPNGRSNRASWKVISNKYLMKHDR